MNIFCENPLLINLRRNGQIYKTFLNSQKDNNFLFYLIHMK